MRTVSMEHQVYAFSDRMAPAIWSSPGERLLFEAQDAFGGQVRTSSDTLPGLDFSRINPATGPVGIEGAACGDTLIVRIEAIELADEGAIVTGPGLGVLADEMKRHVAKILPVRERFVWFDDLKLPVQPMIGVIGVATSDRTYPTGTAHCHGGNMDTKEIGPGATVYFPVAQSGGLLALGDVHAVMGDGEVCVSACEVDAEVTVHVDLIKGRQPSWPILEVGQSVYILVSLPTIQEALEEATRQATKLLQIARCLSYEEACMLASLAVDLRVSQLVDPNKTAKARIPAAVLGAPISELL